jgi:hypothetical protein
MCSTTNSVADPEGLSRIPDPGVKKVEGPGSGSATLTTNLGTKYMGHRKATDF